MAMDVEAKTKWLEALRSGKYTQGKSGLHNIPNDTFCCLGVLCDVQGVYRGEPKDPGSHWNDYVFRMGEDQKDYRSNSDVPDGFCNLTGDDIWYLAGLNDSHDKTFPEIADYIEDNL